MICAQAAAQAGIDRPLPGGPGIRAVPLTTDYDPPLQLLAGSSRARANVNCTTPPIP